MWKVLTLACEELHVQAGTFFKVDDSGTNLEVANTFGILSWRVAKGQFPITQGICGWVAQNNKAALVNDVAKDKRFNSQIDLVTQFKTVSILCVPVTLGQRVFGVIELINRHEQPFSENDVFTITTLVASAAHRLEALSA